MTGRLITAVFFLCSCSSAPETKEVKDTTIAVKDTPTKVEKIKTPPTPPPPSVVKDSTVLDKWRVFTDMYGTNYCNTKNELLPLGGNDEFTSYDGYKHVVFDSLVYFKSENGQEMALAVLYVNLYHEEDLKNDCHSCGAPLALAVYKKYSEGIWRMEKSNPSVDSYGCYGELPGYKLHQSGTALPVLVLESWFMGQGYSYGTDIFISIPDLTPCLSLETNEDNLGTVANEDDPAAYQWSAKYQWKEENGKIVLEVTATAKGEIDKPVGTTVYVWNEKSRKLEKAAQ